MHSHAHSYVLCAHYMWTVTHAFGDVMCQDTNMTFICKYTCIAVAYKTLAVSELFTVYIIIMLCSCISTVASFILCRTMQNLYNYMKKQGCVSLCMYVCTCVYLCAQLCVCVCIYRFVGNCVWSFPKVEGITMFLVHIDASQSIWVYINITQVLSVWIAWLCT